jgi:hypothetical protein
MSLAATLLNSLRQPLSKGRCLFRSVLLSRQTQMHINIVDQTSKASSTKETESGTAGSSGTRSSRQSSASKSATNKRAASASQATAKSSEEASRRAASKPKQKMACVSSSDKPHLVGTTPVTKSDMRKTLEKPTRVRVVPPKKTNPFKITQAQELKSATRKTPKGSITPESRNIVESESQTLTFVNIGGREQKRLVRPDTPSKTKELATTGNTYSEAASSVGRKSADAGTKVDVGPCAVLKDKTNRGKISPISEPRSATNTSTHSQPNKPVIKRKLQTPDGEVIATDSKPVTAKRPCPSEEAHADDRPTKKLATKQIPMLHIEFGHQPEANTDEDTFPGTLPSPTEAEKTPAQSYTPGVDTKLDPARIEEASTIPVATIDSRDLEQTKAAPKSDPSNPNVEDESKSTTSTKPDEAAIVDSKSRPNVDADADDGKASIASIVSEPTSAHAKNSSVKQDSKTSNASRRTRVSTPNPSETPQQGRGVAKVVKKAPKRARDRADDIINDFSDEEDVMLKRKAKKAKCSPDEDSSQRESVDGFEENDEDSTYAPREPRTAKKSRTISSSPVKSTESRGSKEDCKKYNYDKSPAKENKQNGVVLDESR